MQNVRLEVERVYIVRVHGVHMPEMSLEIKEGNRSRKKKPVSNFVVSLVVVMVFYLLLAIAAFQERGCVAFGPEVLLTMVLWLFVYYILEELRRR